MDPNQFAPNLLSHLSVIADPTATSQLSTESLKQTTETLSKQFYTNPLCVPVLAEVVIRGGIGGKREGEPVRQLSAVELRKRVSAQKGSLWLKQDSTTREAIKAQLIATTEESLSNGGLGDREKGEWWLSGESSKLVRHSIARVISSIASLELSQATWPQLLPFLWNVCHSPKVADRELGTFLVFVMVDGFFDGLESEVPKVFELLAKTIQDPESLEVRVNAVRTLARLTEYIDNENQAQLEPVQKLIPGLIQVMATVVETGNEELGKHIFDAWEEFMIMEPPILTPFVKDLAGFWTTAAATTTFDNELRIMCLSALTWLVKFMKSDVTALNLGKQLVEGLMPIVAEEEPEDPDEDSCAKLALRNLDTLASSLPPTHVFPVVFERAQQFVQSPDPRVRKAGVAALASVIEGCANYVQPHVQQLWPYVFNALEDPEVMVRKAGCLAVNCLCEDLAEESAAQHQRLIPALFNVINHPDTQKHAIVALDGLLETLGHDIIVGYLPTLMEHFGGLLDQIDTDQKSTVVGAIGSTAHSAGKAFAPYFPDVMNKFSTYLIETEDSDALELRGVTQDTIGTLAEAVGKEAFAPFLEPCLQKAFEGIKMEGTKMRECSFIFFAVMARVYEADFGGQLTHVMPSLFQSLEQTEIDDDEAVASGSGALSAPNGSTSATTLEEDLDALEDIDEVDLDDDESIGSDEWLAATSAIALEKEIVTDCLGEIFAYVKQPFLPYLEQSVKLIAPLFENDYGGIQKSALGTGLTFITTLSKILNGEPQPGDDGGIIYPPLNDQVKLLINEIVPRIMKLWKDPETEVVAAVCDGFSEAIVEVGPELFTEEHLRTLCQYTLDVIQGKAACQKMLSTNHAIDSSEEDAGLVTSALDLVGSLATAYQGRFVEVFPVFLPEIARYASPDAIATYRSSAVGTMAEIVNGLRGGITPHTEQIYQLFLTPLTNPQTEGDVKSNAAFGIGSLVYHTQQDLTAHFPQVLQAIRPLFDLPEGVNPNAAVSAPPEAVTAQNMRDNAVGAVARLILKNTNAVPLGEVLPIFFNALPLKKDMAENPKTFQAIGHLLAIENPLIFEHVDGLLQLFAHVLSSPAEGDKAQLDTKTRLGVIDLVKGLNGRFPQKVAATEGLAQYL